MTTTEPPRDRPPTLDVPALRERFPQFRAPELDGWVFLENAGGSYPAADVVETLTSFYSTTKVQVGHPFPASQLAAGAMADGRAAMCRWLGVEDDELQVGPSTTANTNVLAEAFRRALPDDAAVVVTAQDHEANRGPWLRLAADGVEVREWPVDPATGRLSPDDLRPLLADGRVRVVAFTHCSNLVGELHDVAAWCEVVHDAGAVAVVDGTAAAPHGLPWVPDTGADAYLFSTYKTWGPHQGVMTVRRDLLDRLPNLGHHFNAGVPGKQLVPAGPDHAQVAALAGVGAYLDHVDATTFGPSAPAPAERTRRVAAAFRSHEREVVAPLLDLARRRDDVRLLGPDDVDTHVPTVSLVLDRAGRDVAADLARHRVACAGGHFYAPRLVEAVGVAPDHGVLRLSGLHTTSVEDAVRTVEALEAVLDARSHP